MTHNYGYFHFASSPISTIPSPTSKRTQSGNSADTIETSTKFVTVRTKSSSHPYFDQGSSKGYFIDGIESPSLTLSQDVVYRFDQSDISNTNHRILFFTDANRINSYQTNISEVGIPGSTGAYTEITLNSGTPIEIFYQCQNHPLMGSNIKSSTSSNDSIISSLNNDLFDGGTGNDTVTFTGNFSDYAFTRSTSSLEIADQRTGTNDGVDILKNIEFVQFSDQIVEESKVDVIKTFSGNFSDYKFYNKNGVYKLKALSDSDTLDFFKSAEVKDNGSGDIALTFKTQEENSLLDVGGNEDGTKGFKSVKVYSYDSSQEEFFEIDVTGLQNGYDYRGQVYTIRQAWIDEWNGTDSLRFDFNYINNAGTEYLDHYYLEINNDVFTFSNTPKNNNLLGTKDITDTDSGLVDITGYPLLRFSGEDTTSIFRDVSAIADIKGTFDQITGLNTDDAKMFRLYNAAFKRFPDADGLAYWINKYTPDENGIRANDSRTVALSFIGSDEFKRRYGDNITDEELVRTMYVNVLGRDIDTETGMPYNADGIGLDESGFNYWIGQLNHVDPNKRETDYEVLLGFAESGENKALFTEMTGFS